MDRQPETVDTVESAIGAVQADVDRALRSSRQIKVLEAGCGSCSAFWLGNAHIVGVDISEKQLNRNNVVHEKIVGDIQVQKLPQGEFDIVLCWYVLEHLPNPELALENLVGALRSDGLLILAVPSASSMKGLITRFSPHWFHVLVYRWLLGHKDAGKDDSAPFPTFLRWSLRPVAFQRFARQRGFSVERLQMFEDYTQNRLRSRFLAFRMAYRLLYGIGYLCTGGRANIYLSDFVAVLRKGRPGP